MTTADAKLANNRYSGLLKKLDNGDLVEVSDLKQFFRVTDFSAPEILVEWEKMSPAQQRGYLCNTIFPKVTIQQPSKPATPNVNDKPPVVIAHSPAAAGVELSSVLQYLTQHDQDQAALVEALSGITTLWGAERLRLALGGILTKMTAFPPTKVMGVPSKIGLKEYSAWQDANKQDVMCVGPMMLYKLLHQMGVKWGVYRKDNLNYIEFTRNRVSIESFTKYIVDGLPDDPREAASQMRIMLEGLRVKGKQIEFFPIDYRIYKYIDYINAQYDIQTNKVIELFPRKKPAYVHEGLLNQLEQTVAKIKADKIPAKDADMAIDKIAQLLSITLTPNALSAIDSILGSQDLSLQADLGVYLEILQGMNKVAVSQRFEKIREEFASACTPDEACKRLEISRDERNRTRVSQYLNKNVGSMMGDHLPQFVDTYAKGKNIVKHMEALDILPTEEDYLVVTGIAYGHMLPVVEKLVPPEHIKYYDIEKASNSLAVFEKGNVYRVEVKDKYLFDDTNTFKIKDTAKAEYGGMKNDKGDHVKLARIVQQKPKVAYLKMTMRSFETQEFRRRVQDILYPNKEVIFPYVRCFKFGKLHNDEFYMVLSTIDHLPVTNWQTVIGDLKAISASMIMANEFIDMAEKAGTRLCNPERQPDITTPILWTALIKALPANWFWYLDVPTEDAPYTDGNELVGIVNIESINEFEDAAYMDFDGDGRPRWEDEGLDYDEPNLPPAPKVPREKIDVPPSDQMSKFDQVVGGVAPPMVELNWGDDDSQRPPIVVPSLAKKPGEQKKGPVKGMRYSKDKGPKRQPR